MQQVRSLFRIDRESRELLQATSRNLIFTTLSIYVAWHFIATLTWPRTFSTSLWAVTFLMLFISAAGIKLAKSYFILAQVIWLGGLAAADLSA